MSTARAVYLRKNPLSGGVAGLQLVGPSFWVRATVVFVVPR